MSPTPRSFIRCERFSLGPIDASTVAKVVKEVTPEERRRLALMEARPPIDSIFNLHDFENVAKLVLPDKAWVRDRRASAFFSARRQY